MSNTSLGFLEVCRATTLLEASSLRIRPTRTVSELRRDIALFNGSSLLPHPRMPSKLAQLQQLLQYQMEELVQLTSLSPTWALMVSSQSQFLLVSPDTNHKCVEVSLEWNLPVSLRHLSVSITIVPNLKQRVSLLIYFFSHQTAIYPWSLHWYWPNNWSVSSNWIQPRLHSTTLLDKNLQRKPSDLVYQRALSFWTLWYSTFSLGYHGVF